MNITYCNKMQYYADQPEMIYSMESLLFKLGEEGEMVVLQRRLDTYIHIHTGRGLMDGTVLIRWIDY